MLLRAWLAGGRSRSRETTTQAEACVVRGSLSASEPVIASHAPPFLVAVGLDNELTMRRTFAIGRQARLLRPIAQKEAGRLAAINDRDACQAKAVSRTDGNSQAGPPRETFATP
jgi:hypothetical protein